MVAGALSRGTLLHPVYDLKVTQMNVQCSLIRELMLYEFGVDQQPKTFVMRKFVFYGVSTFVGYLMPNPFLYK